MQIRRIDFDDQGRPTGAHVEASHNELLYLALLTGKRSPAQDNALMPDGAEASNGIYECLLEGFFDRFYPNGTRDALQGRT